MNRNPKDLGEMAKIIDKILKIINWGKRKDLEQSFEIGNDLHTYGKEIIRNKYVLKRSSKNSNYEYRLLK